MISFIFLTFKMPVFLVTYSPRYGNDDDYDVLEPKYNDPDDTDDPKDGVELVQSVAIDASDERAVVKKFVQLANVCDEINTCYNIRRFIINMASNRLWLITRRNPNDVYDDRMRDLSDIANNNYAVDGDGVVDYIGKYHAYLIDIMQGALDENVPWIEIKPLIIYNPFSHTKRAKH